MKEIFAKARQPYSWVGPSFSRFPTFYPFADKNSIVSSYFIVEKGFFLWDI